MAKSTNVPRQFDRIQLASNTIHHTKLIKHPIKLHAQDTLRTFGSAHPNTKKLHNTTPIIGQNVDDPAGDGESLITPAVQERLLHNDNYVCGSEAAPCLERDQKKKWAQINALGIPTKNLAVPTMTTIMSSNRRVSRLLRKKYMLRHAERFAVHWTIKYPHPPTRTLSSLR